MGLFDSITKKIANVMEKGMSKNLSGDSKVEYEKQKEEQQKITKLAGEKEEEIKKELSLHKTQASKDELKNLEQLLVKIDVLDDKKLWVGGFENYKLNQNSKFANIFSGNKNIKIFAVKGETYFYCKFDGENFLAYKQITKETIANVEIENLLKKKFLVKLKDGSVFTIDVTENKNKLSELKTILSK